MIFQIGNMYDPLTSSHNQGYFKVHFNVCKKNNLHGSLVCSRSALLLYSENELNKVKFN